MATEEEEYYDSIDDSEFEECRSFCNDKFREDDPDIDDEYSGKLNELVPFYMGNVEKSEIESTKTDTKSNSVTTLKNNKLKRRPPQMSLTDRRKNRSYLTMFYARAGQSGKNGALNTSRATCAELTPKSNLEYESEQSLDFENADSEGYALGCIIKASNNHCLTDCIAGLWKKKIRRKIMIILPQFYISVNQKPQ